MAATSDTGSLKFQEKAGYALGDAASNFYWRMFDTYLMYFYVTFFGLDPALAGTMFLVTRIIDAVSDPVMGACADRTQTRLGKFRPYLLWGILPITAAGVLTFTVPDVGEDGKLIYAYATYIFMMLTYTFINVPYGALMGVMTNNSQDRTTLTSFRFIGAFSGGALVTALTPDLVAWFGGEDEAFGWQMTMLLFGGMAAILFALTFKATKERVMPIAKAPAPVTRDLKDLLGNKPWLVLFTLALLIMVTISMRSNAGTFYIEFVAGRKDLMGAFNTTYMISLMVGAAITPFMTRFVDKRRLLLILMTLVAVLSAGFYFVSKEDITLMFILHGAIGLCLGPKSPLVFSMYADTADYSEWKTGRRATAMIFSAAAFSQKMGGALAGAMIGWGLAGFGFVAGEVQSTASLNGIALLLTMVPAAFAVLSVICVSFYSLSEDQVRALNADLAARKTKAETA